LFITCYILIFSTNIYDLFWLMFCWDFLPIVDWKSYICNPFYCSIILLVFFLSIYKIVICKYELNLYYLILAFLLYCMCQPLNELYCFKFSGPICNLLKKYNILPKTNEDIIFSKLNETEVEVSKNKLVNRIISIIYSTLLIIVIKYFLKNTNNHEVQNILLSCIQLILFYIAYFTLSVINQTYVVYFNKKLIKTHNKLNNINKDKKSKKKKKKNIKF